MDILLNFYSEYETDISKLLTLRYDENINISFSFCFHLFSVFIMFKSDKIDSSMTVNVAFWKPRFQIFFLFFFVILFCVSLFLHFSEINPCHITMIIMFTKSETSQRELFSKKFLKSFHNLWKILVK